MGGTSWVAPGCLLIQACPAPVQSKPVQSQSSPGPVRSSQVQYRSCPVPVQLGPVKSSPVYRSAFFSQDEQEGRPKLFGVLRLGHCVSVHLGLKRVIVHRPCFRAPRPALISFTSRLLRTASRALPQGLRRNSHGSGYQLEALHRGPCSVNMTPFFYRLLSVVHCLFSGFLACTIARPCCPISSVQSSPLQSTPV